jgi:hypothetical protein
MFVCEKNYGDSQSSDVTFISCLQMRQKDAETKNPQLLFLKFLPRLYVATKQKKMEDILKMSTVENFCARQGNFLRRRLVFQGEVVRHLNPNDNVCRQLHEKWMRMSGRQVAYLDFKKALRFESTDNSVYVWLHKDPTAAIIAGLGALGLTTAAVGGYYYRKGSATPGKPTATNQSGMSGKEPEVKNASTFKSDKPTSGKEPEAKNESDNPTSRSDENGPRASKQPEIQPDLNESQSPDKKLSVAVADRPETWDDAPPETKPSGFEFSPDSGMIPAYLLMRYQERQELKHGQEGSEYEDDSLNEYNEILSGVMFGLDSEMLEQQRISLQYKRDFKVLLTQMQSGEIIQAKNLADFKASMAQVVLINPPGGYNPLTFPVSVAENSLIFPSAIVKTYISPDLTCIKCGDKDLSTKFEDINRQFVDGESSLEESLTYDNGVVRNRNANECILHIPTNSRIASADDLNMFVGIESDPYEHNSDSIEIELTSGELSKQLLAPRIETRRPDSRSLISRLSLRKLTLSPDEANAESVWLVFSLTNTQNVSAVTFDCPHIVMNELKFDLTCVVFTGKNDTSDVALLVDKTWIFYGGQDLRKPTQHLRKKVFGNDLSYIRAIPYLLIFTKVQ